MVLLVHCALISPVEIASLETLCAEEKLAWDASCVIPVITMFFAALVLPLMFRKDEPLTIDVELKKLLLRILLLLVEEEKYLLLNSATAAIISR